MSEIESAVRQLRDAQAMSRLVGQSPAFLASTARLPVIARSDAAVLISGETGTGKELVARAIHYCSERAAFPFVPVNCGSLPDTLLEDELFGHERGAFTDARDRRTGLIAQAHRGTLFLDEVDSLTPRAQVALLRVLQDRTFRALGASHESEANVRFVAATNAGLAPLVQRGSFRTDLFYRLCVFSIDLPALRERPEDILPLAAHFLRRCASLDGEVPRLAPSACAALLSHDWPGNVRELENAIVRGAQLAATSCIEGSDLGLPTQRPIVPTVARPAPGVPTPLAAVESAIAESPPDGARRSYRSLKRQAIEAFERDYLVHLMSAHAGNVTHAARTAGKERRELGKLLKKHRIDARQFAASR
jgi:DNA-binding NtrC family response regulator